MSLAELPLLPAAPPAHDEAWHRAARRARQLSWLSLAWMTVEGVAGLLAGAEAGSLSLLAWAASSFVEGLASAIVIWRFTGTRTLSASSERRAQRWVAGSFLLLVPVFLYESVHRLVTGGRVDAGAGGVALLVAAIVLMPALGRAKLRLARRLGSGATAGEGTQNLLCAAQAAIALLALVGAGWGLALLDPVGALAISAVAVRECRDLWRGEADCCAPVGFGDGAACDDRCCG